MSKQLSQLSTSEEYLQQDRESYRLVDGIFEPAQATEVLMTLIDDKIRFHQRNNLSSKERCGKPDTASLRRVDELRRCKADLVQRIEAAERAGQRLAINCAIAIEPVDD
ncbi:hypothetical protein DWB85_14245 [Seongchinamella sediminis]|uniref:Uncharacterized protein n=1 Tax=Seongchinamella sediminis TaxID=2283635 RepID=A0A3L7DWA3_9GAMM|nr:hypothetical protein [Seongchinamella sediminis]RLQ21055.1 hypothetical protein DWB85_14245 [Seongchinamella sediminis]